jgi:hypothetical protein
MPGADPMNVLFGSPLGAALAKPWVDPVGLFGLRRWYLPLSRLWAAANAAGDDVAGFRGGVGVDLPAFWSGARLQSLLQRNGRALATASAARTAWEDGIFDARTTSDAGALDRQRRIAATRHLSMRAWFYPLLFPKRPPLARWRIDDPAEIEREFPPFLCEPVASATTSIDVSRSFVRNGVREYWLRSPTPSPRLHARAGSELMYARVVEPAGSNASNTLISGSGLCLEFELLTVARDPGAQLAGMGWRVIEPISPYHGLRAMPGYYGGEPFFAEGPTSSVDLISGQAIESALLIAWARERFGGKVALAGVSMTSFVAQHVASRCGLWPVEVRPDAVMLISHSGRVEDVTFGGELAAMLGLDKALIRAGWTRESLARLSRLIDPSETPGLPPSHIISVLGETDRWVPFDDGLALAHRWRLPEENIFRYRLGHLGMPVQLTRDAAPFERLRRVLETA